MKTTDHTALSNTHRVVDIAKTKGMGFEGGKGALHRARGCPLQGMIAKKPSNDDISPVNEKAFSCLLPTLMQVCCTRQAEEDGHVSSLCQPPVEKSTIMQPCPPLAQLFRG